MNNLIDPIELLNIDAIGYSDPVILIDMGCPPSPSHDMIEYIDTHCPPSNAYQYLWKDVSKEGFDFPPYSFLRYSDFLKEHNDL